MEKIPLLPSSSPPDSSGKSAFVIVSLSYLFFTITDGALRLVVLLTAYRQGFTAIEIAIMFALYECFGIFTNLLGGVAGAKWGLKVTLIAGLCCQMISISSLWFLNYNWPRYWIVCYITLSQAVSGIAKDLVKMSGKSVTKISHDKEGQMLLLKMVAYLTGLKNSMKGFGYFWGSLLLYLLNTFWSLMVLFFMVALILPFAIFYLSMDLGKSPAVLTLSQILNKGWNVNFLSLARFFLFGSRDVWFEIALPLYLRGVLNWSYTFVGGFLACWIIFYGAVQSSTPQFILAPIRCSPPASREITYWTSGLAILTAAIATTFTDPLSYINGQYNATVVSIVIGLFSFAFVFAVNSSIHSYLILAYTNRDKVAMNVGFYYMANAGGRLTGTLASGFIYQYYGLYMCLWASLVFLIGSIFACIFLTSVPEENKIETWGD